MVAHTHRAAGAQRGRLLAVLGISTGILIPEVAVGLTANSLALLADAAHVFADVLSTTFALVAIGLAARPATRARSYGYYHFEILAAVLNALLLVAIAAYVLIEAWRRLFEAPVVATGPTRLVAAGPVVANGIAACSRDTVPLAPVVARTLVSRCSGRYERLGRSRCDGLGKQLVGARVRAPT